ncbi:hypothetical protein L2E82_40121 [Cichorium intybus]|uniref:Uncharacterized protein n=1 Tax=Cichorium intybus TaxID=13427 RepID=A0ACB9ALU9_CICIN|nr:hypothetical protein L2E82_40121 [Cichorium intybus]
MVHLSSATRSDDELESTNPTLIPPKSSRSILNQRNITSLLILAICKRNWLSLPTSASNCPLSAFVHKAVTKDGLQVAMKIQYMGVADSIESDIDNVKLLLDYTNLIPENLYLDRAMKL